MTKEPPHDESTNSKTSYYDILRVSPNASFEAIKSSHRILAKQYHPDKSHSITSSSDQFRRIQEAWECLRDVKKRKEYDEQLKRQQNRWNSRRQSAIVVPLSQWEQVIVDVASSNGTSRHDDNDDSDQQSSQLPQHQFNPNQYQQQRHEEQLKNDHESREQRDGGNFQRQQQEILFLYQCRCGHEIELWTDQIIPKGDEVLLDCTGCSNVFCVVNDERYDGAK
jgi:curved DNA-binding protein CbpA